MWAVVLRYGVPAASSVGEVSSRVETLRDHDEIELAVSQAPKPAVAGRIPAVRESAPTAG
jgi:hypothetical protein